MLAIVLIVGLLLVVATCSAVAAYRHPGSRAWSREYDHEGLGLQSELALLLLVVVVGVAMSIIMYDGFRSLFLGGAWQSWWYIGASGAGFAAVLIYMLGYAPGSLARKYGVEQAQVRRQCRLPYLQYTPYSIVLLVGLVLPVLAVLVISLQADVGDMATARDDLATNGALVSVLAERDSAAAVDHVAIYGLEYRAAVGSVQGTVSRYLWVVGVFLFFLMVIVNTRITFAYDEVAQDIFKWMMWGLLGVAVAICLIGLSQHRGMRDLATTTYEEIASTAAANDELGLVVAAKAALLDVREESAARVLRGGFVAVLSLVLLSNISQFLIARLTHRSAVEVIFPRRVARFLNGFLVTGKEPPQRPARDGP